MKRIYFFWLSILTFVGGMINAQAIIAVSIPVSHFTGNITYIALNIVKSNQSIMWMMFVALVMFFSGAFFSGYFFYDKKVKYSKSYSNYLFINAAIFIILTFAAHMTTLFLYCAFYLGMQNGMLFKYKGTLTRTTHITGYLTDSGVSLALAAKGQKDQLSLGLFYVLNMFIFAIGCFFGVIAYQKTASDSFYMTACIIFIAGLWYRIKIYNNENLFGNLQ